MLNMINRARMMMGMGMTEVEAAQVLIDSGASNEDVFLAVKAAVILEVDDAS